MKNYKNIVMLMFGAVLVFMAGVVISNQSTNNTSNQLSRSGLLPISYEYEDEYSSYNNGNYSEEEDYFEEMHNYCHGNRGTTTENQSNEDTFYNNMMNNNEIRNY